MSNPCVDDGDDDEDEFVPILVLPLSDDEEDDKEDDVEVLGVVSASVPALVEEVDVEMEGVIDGSTDVSAGTTIQLKQHQLHYQEQQQHC